LNLVKKLLIVLAEFFGIIGGLITIHAHLLDKVFPRYIEEKVFPHNILMIEKSIMYVLCFIWFIALIYYIVKIVSIHVGEKKRYSREFLKKSNIGYEVGSFWDVVKKHSKEEELAIIIGVNNRFRLDTGYINNRSLVYDYVKQLDEKTVREIENRIQGDLKDKIMDREPDGTPIFEYGSICVFPKQAQIQYEAALLAMCEPSKANISQRFTSERKVLVESLEKMFEQMPKIFTNATIIVPLIGTSSSGSPLSHEEVAKYLISAFADYSRITEGRLAKRFIISIYNKDIKQKFINLEEIKRHIDNECDSKEFSYSKLKFQLAKEA
jgi:hypothetical protein